MGQTDGRSDFVHSTSVDTATHIVAAFLAQGLRDIAYCPGSRNAPFAYVLADAEARGLANVATFVDERSAGFWATGAARAAGSSAVITTSGTAAAELHASLEEARQSGLAVIAVTADRPHELTRVGASQTIIQEDLFGKAPLESITIPAGAQGTHTALRAVVRSMSEAGPVHLNVALREPLIPSGNIEWPAIKPVNAPISSLQHLTWAEAVDPDLDTVVVAGMGADQATVFAAEAAGIPVLSEPMVRGGFPAGSVLTLALSSPVEQVVVIGRPTLSRAVSTLIREARRKVIVAERFPWPDPSGGTDLVVQGLSGEPAPARVEWSKKWASAAKKVAENLPTSGLGLLTAANAIWKAGPQIPLWLGASNTVRAFEIIASGARGPVMSNRGVAGIDGTISSAMGFASAADLPIRVVLGDLSFAYDMNVLAARPGKDVSMQVVVMDDGGGSIFASLEHGMKKYAHLYERFFAVPQALDPVAAAESMGWNARRIDTLAELEISLASPIDGRSLLYVPIKRPTDEIRHVQKTFSIDSDS